MVKYTSFNPMTFKLANSWQAEIPLQEEECSVSVVTSQTGKLWCSHIMEIKPTLTCVREVTQ